MKFLVKNEWDKHASKKQNLIFFIFFLLLLIVSIPLANDSKNPTEDWTEQIQAEIEVNNELINGGELSDSLVTEIKKQNTLLSYSLENNIDLTNKSIWEVTQSSLPLIIVLIIYIVSISCGIFQDEVKEKTIINLFVSPYSTKKIILSKILFLFLLSVSYIVIMFSITFIAGLILSNDYKFNLIDVSLINGSIIERNLSLNIIATYIFHMFELFFLSALAITLSIILNNKSLSLLIVIGVLIGAEHLRVPYIGDYLIFNNLNLTKHLDHSKLSVILANFFSSVTINTIFIIALLWIALTLTNRRELT